MNLNLLELFGGIGAPRKALQNLGIKVNLIDYVEFDPSAVDCYNAIFNAKYKPQDIRTWKLNKPHPDIDILVHGSPCQDFSMSGKRDITRNRSILYQRTLEIINHELNPKPKIVIWENVKGLLIQSHLKYFNHYLEAMDTIGYKNYWKVLNASNFGIPQKRERVFVVSIRKDLDLNFDFNNLKHKQLKLLNEFLEPFEALDKNLFVQAKTLLNGLNENRFILNKDNVYEINPSYTNLKQQLLGEDIGMLYVPIYRTFNQDNMTHYRDADSLRTISGSSGGHQKILEPVKFTSKFKSKWNLENKISNEPKLGVPIFKISGLYYQIRKLTPRECWRLMGFSDEDFNRAKGVVNAKVKLYMRASNSIVVQVLEAIFKCLLI